MKLKPALFVLLSGLLTSSTAFAQGTTQPGSNPASGGQCSYEDYKENLGKSEGAYNRKNTTDGETVYFGRYQMEHQALETADVALDGSTPTHIIWAPGFSESYFLENPQVQNDAYDRYAKKNWGYISAEGAQSLLGKRLENGAIVTQSGLLKAAQFGPVRMGNFVRNGGKCDSTTEDGNHVCLAEYMRSGANFDVSNITGLPSDVDGECQNTNPEQPYEGDTTSRTCGPTVKMLQEIPCGSYPANLQSFCYRYKPLQMNMAMCTAAEKWAENTPPSGPQLEACKEQTFGQGTSSWSYVHACAKAKPVEGEQGKDNSSQKIVGAADDPACYERLKALGVEFEPMGKLDISTAGKTCIVPNALSYSGKAVPFDRAVTLNCALAEQIEAFGPSARSLGITQYNIIGTLDCRAKRNADGDIPGTTTLHGFGNAIDVSGFGTSAGTIKTAEYFSNPTKSGWLRKVVDMGCSYFDGTLAFTYYKQKYSHIHWQATEATSCDGRR